MPFFNRKRLRSRSRSVRRAKRRYVRNLRKYSRRSRINRSTAYHLYRRTVLVEELNDGGGVHKAWDFKLSNLVNYSDFTNLYDAYKIKKVILRIEPTSDGNDLYNIGTLSNKFIRVVHDYDDAGVLTAEADYFEYQNMKSYPACGGVIKITLYPKVAGMTYRGVATTGYSQIRPPFLDTASSADVPHYGIKAYFPGIGQSGKLGWRIFATYIFICKDSR